MDICSGMVAMNTPPFQPDWAGYKTGLEDGKKEAQEEVARLRLLNAELRGRSMSRPMSDRGQGRKPLSPSGEAMKPRQIRMTDAEWAKCMALGGGAWVRAQIKRAKEPS
jgi:hypothetical protein